MKKAKINMLYYLLNLVPIYFLYTLNGKNKLDIFGFISINY
ncbi:hypothetical protein [Streptobacillus ratti]|nr:hypothetical protein [Streptobacillus ratti]